MRIVFVCVGFGPGSGINYGSSAYFGFGSGVGIKVLSFIGIFFFLKLLRPLSLAPRNNPKLLRNVFN